MEESEAGSRYAGRVGDIAAFITPEAGQNNKDLNRDGDATDRVLQFYDHGSGNVTNVKQAAAELGAR